jgi:hypothetical protein
MAAFNWSDKIKSSILPARNREQKVVLKRKVFGIHLK